MQLYYVNATNHISVTSYLGDSWDSVYYDDSGPNFMISEHIAASSSRQLSASIIKNISQPVELQAIPIVVYEDANGNVTALNGRQTLHKLFEWEDFSHELYNTYPQIKLSAPFTIADIDLANYSTAEPSGQIFCRNTAVALDEGGRATHGSIVSFLFGADYQNQSVAPNVTLMASMVTRLYKSTYKANLRSTI